jgi:hypothetical protein
MINELKTNFLDFKTVPPKRVSMSVPITLPCTAYTKRLIEASGIFIDTFVFICINMFIYIHTYISIYI